VETFGGVRNKDTFHDRMKDALEWGQKYQNESYFSRGAKPLTSRWRPSVE
jgi:hypothetical protein